jgi:hypothetical protein
LEFCENKDSLYLRESELVNSDALADPMNMNLRLGGRGGWEHCYKLGAKRMNEIIWKDDEFRHRKSENGKRQYLNGNLKTFKELGLCNGRPMLVETKNKIGIANAISQKRREKFAIWITINV